jgi:hypothetical protein
MHLLSYILYLQLSIFFNQISSHNFSNSCWATQLLCIVAHENNLGLEESQDTNNSLSHKIKATKTCKLADKDIRMKKKNILSNGDHCAGDYGYKDEQIHHKLETWRLKFKKQMQNPHFINWMSPTILVFVTKENYKWQCNDALYSRGPIM